MATSYETIRYHLDGPIARITLHRPERYNAIVDPMPAELRHAVEAADADPAARVIVLAGSGPGFCAGYDLEVYAATPGPNPGVQELPFDATVDLRMMGRNTEDFMALWRCQTPTIAQVHGAAVAGGSDIALCCDLVLAADDATFGYPPARVWGVPTTMMWIQRVGPERAKRLLFTGDVIDGREAARIGLILEAVPADGLAAHVEALATRIAGVPANQLAMSKTVVNQAVSAQGLATTQLLATLFDGMARHTAEGLAFKARAEEVGWQQAVAERDAL
ncbi:MAG: crotonase/enoyl-CoA hydratase family protein [Nitriliruptoraceae bacterium]